jgi:hypothetical protein
MVGAQLHGNDDKLTLFVARGISSLRFQPPEDADTKEPAFAAILVTVDGTTTVKDIKECIAAQLPGLPSGELEVSLWWDPLPKNDDVIWEALKLVIQENQERADRGDLESSDRLQFLDFVGCHGEDRRQSLIQGGEDAVREFIVRQIKELRFPVFSFQLPGVKTVQTQMENAALRTFEVLTVELSAPVTREMEALWMVYADPHDPTKVAKSVPLPLVTKTGEPLSWGAALRATVLFGDSSDCYVAFARLGEMAKISSGSENGNVSEDLRGSTGPAGASDDADDSAQLA